MYCKREGYFRFCHDYDLLTKISPWENIEHPYVIDGWILDKIEIVKIKPYVDSMI